MLTEKDYCDYETCVALKELGYNEKSNWWFSKFLNEDSGQMELVHICDNPAHLNYDSWGIVPKDFIIRPSLYEAQKWLREEKKLHITIYSQSQESWQYRITKPHQKLEEGLHGEDFTSYEEALLEGIKEAIKILKEEK